MTSEEVKKIKITKGIGARVDEIKRGNPEGSPLPKTKIVIYFGFAT